MPTAAATPTAAPTRAVAITKAASERGERYFLLNGCFACHGPAGEGYIGPRLAGTGLPYESVLNQVRSPQTSRMPRFAAAALTDDAVADIYAFLRSLRP
ncbi:MAG TPA: cytochrome c [Candidatus Limnocylindria bacterium]|nr:cytochrome c [Candidatus Limnocylindria bacterium]